MGQDKMNGMFIIVTMAVFLSLTTAHELPNNCSDSNYTQSQRGTIVNIAVNTANDNLRIQEKLDQLEKKMDTIVTEIKQEIETIVTKIHHAVYEPSPPLHSCDEIKATWPYSTSGYYIVDDNNGHTRAVYCSMENTCGDAKGGWTRVAYLNMSDSSEQCPSGFRLYEQNGTRACGKQMTSAGCQSVTFPSYNINYTQVCGRVIGYQLGSPDALHASYGIRNNINQVYVDGVSITRGSPREHIWTFMAALQENYFLTNGDYVCPCAPNSSVLPPSFVGNDYFCESGQPGDWDANSFLTADPLWDGKQCGLIEEACCNVTGIPWFNKVLQQPTTDYIELRVCGNQVLSDEDSPVGYYEIFVK